jgi:transcriptional regulator with XRE-family HTH domain
MTHEQLKLWAQANGVSQSKLASLAGVSIRTIKSWWSGAARIPFTVAVLCEASNGTVAGWEQAAEKAKAK